MRFPVFLLALAGCASAPRSAAPAALADEAAVYASVVDHFVPSGKIALVLDSTAVLRGPVAGDVAQRVSAELASSFVEANRAPRALPQPLPSTRAIRLARRGSLPIFAPPTAGQDLEARWRRFNEQFPGAEGFYEFSGIGFDAARSVAVLYTSHTCGTLCGSGNLVTLRRAGGRWVVAEAAMLWVS
jgi:hypothetical protein